LCRSALVSPHPVPVLVVPLDPDMAPPEPVDPEPVDPELPMRRSGAQPAAQAMATAPDQTAPARALIFSLSSFARSSPSRPYVKPPRPSRAAGRW
jgi:hypothetical protein